MARAMETAQQRGKEIDDKETNSDMDISFDDNKTNETDGFTAINRNKKNHKKYINKEKKEKSASNQYTCNPCNIENKYTPNWIIDNVGDTTDE